jgi:predicted RNA-binding protein
MIVKETATWGVGERHRKQLSNAKISDICAFYLIGVGKRKKPSIGGVFRIVSEPYEDQSDIFPSKPSKRHSKNETYPYRVLLSPIKLFEPEVEFKPLVSSLKFIKNKEHYASYLMGRAMIKIPADDMRLIYSIE